MFDLDRLELPYYFKSRRVIKSGITLMSRCNFFSRRDNCFESTALQTMNSRAVHNVLTTYSFDQIYKLGANFLKPNVQMHEPTKKLAL